MLTVQLTKLETALDQLKKVHPNLEATDAAMIAAAVSLTGRHALAVYEGEQFEWPGDYEKLTAAMVPHLKAVQSAVDATAPKKTKANATEEEPIPVAVGLKPNFEAGERSLGDRNDLKTILGDILKEGVEFVYAPSDLGWQWALDRANWSTLSGSEVSRRIVVEASFTEGATGVVTGAPKKKVSAKGSAAAAAAE
ncbi:hypothetical protein EON81_13825 [bacterium]|nr:MAG: hypothetical protein EON81_13825 [bacterium]